MTSVTDWICSLVVLIVVVRPCRSSVPLRNLAVGDFSELNELLEGVVVSLPDIEASSALISLRLTNLRCTAFRVDDFTVQSSKSTRGTTTVQLDVVGLDMVCYTDYRYTFLFTRSGSADLFSYDNQASVTMAFDSPRVVVPTVSRVEECTPQVNIANMEFRGGISAIVLDAVEGLMRERVERVANERICQELRALSSTFIADWLSLADETLAQYPPNQSFDPLLLERGLSVPSGVRILDLKDQTSAVAKWLDKMLTDVVDFASKPVDGGLGREEINLNVLIRQNILDGERAFILDANGQELFYNHDRFLETTCVLDTVKIFGLDTLDSFEPLNRIGKHTIQNKLSWNRLSIEADILIEVKPSTKPESIFLRGTRNGIQEKVTVKFGIENIKADAAILLAVDELELGRLSLSSLLVSDNVIDCFFSTFYRARLSGLSLEAVDILPPTLEGFVSRGLDRVISKSVDTAFLMYESAMLTAAPGFFEKTFREFINERFLDRESQSSVINRECPSQLVASSPDGYVDFRDLFLSPHEAAEAGGMGTEPYGDIIYKAVSEFKERLLETDEDGDPRVNSVVRSSLTQESNNSEPTLFVGDFLNWNSSIEVAGLKAVAGAKLLDVKIYNLDTFGPPLQILEPVILEPHQLNNTASLGAVRFEAILVISLSDGAGLDIRNEIAVTLDFTSANLALLFRLRLLEEPFFSVPLADTLNPNCWISTMIPGSELTEGIVLQSDISIDQLYLNISCVSCSSPLFDDLIYKLYSPEASGNATSTIVNLMSVLRESNILNVTSDQILAGASKQCPHNNAYDPNFSYGEYFVESGGGSGFSKATRDRKAMYFTIANAIVAVGLALTFVAFKWQTRRKHRNWIASISSEAMERLKKRESMEAERNRALDEATDSLYQSQELPRHVRFFVPFLLFVTIFIQLAGHLAVLSTVDIVGQIAGEPFVVKEFLTFSFFKAAARTFKNGGSEMAILLFLFTGIWPYIKLTACIILWFVPPCTVSVTRRGAIFLWLDVFAKLSMVDVFTMLIGVAFLLVFIGGTEDSEFGEYFSSIIIVNPHAGFYCIIIAQRITRISARYLLDCHDLVVATNVQEIQRSRSLKMMSTEIFGYANEEDSPGELLIQVTQSSTPERVRSLNTASTKSWRDDDEATSVQLSRDEDKEIPPAPRETASGASRNIPFRRLVQCWKKTYQTIDASMTSRRTHPTASKTRETRQRLGRFTFWRRVAGGFTTVSILMIAVIGCALAPSISIDAKSIWGMFESGKTFSQVVKDYPFFRVMYSLLVQARFVLASLEEKIGLGLLLLLVVIAVTGYPVMKMLTSFRAWLQHQPKPFNVATVARRFWSFLRKIPGRTCCCVESLRKVPTTYSTFDSDLDLVPAYKMKAWSHLEVYIVAFIIACWQLGAAASYAIHIYCFILEAIYTLLAYLGLVESTSAQCFREQASTPSFVLILIMAFLLLLLSFLIEARGQYKKVMAKAAEDMKEATIL